VCFRPNAAIATRREKDPDIRQANDAQRSRIDPASELDCSHLARVVSISDHSGRILAVRPAKRAVQRSL